MGLLQRVTQLVFKEQLTKMLRDIEQSRGSEFYGALLRNVQNQPVYMPDNVETYVNEGYLFNPSVYSVVSFISQKAGAIPWGVYEVKNDKALQLYKSTSGDLPLFRKNIIKTKALIELPDHELNEILRTPNILQGWADFMEQVVGFKLVTGNSYIHAIGPTGGANAGKIKELWTLPSQMVTIVAGNYAQPVSHYEVKGDRSLKIPAEQIMHLKYWTPQYVQGRFLYGISPIQAGRRVVTKSNSSYDAMVSSFQHMGPPGILSPESGTEGLTEAQQDMMERRLEKKTGSKRAGRPLIFSAPVKWQQIGMSPADLAIIESDKMDLRAICNLYHVPSELFNDAGNKTYSNTKEAGSAVYTNAVIPALTQFRDAFNLYIKNRYEGRLFIDFDLSAISELQEDMSMQSNALAPAWWLTLNEKREVMGFPIDEVNPLANEYFIPTGQTPMSETPEAEEEINDATLEEVEKMLKLR